ncbi:MAG TPA: tetratricopeptide repeat protein [Pyrinomonadaceae bacterium]
MSSNFKQIMRFRRTITLALVSTLLALSVVTVVAQSQAKPADRTRPRITVSPTPKTAPANEIDKLLATGQDAHEAGRYEEAITAYNRVIALSRNQPRAAAVANFLIGNVNMSQKKFGNAEIAFQKAIALNPAHADSYNNLGEALGELKQFPRAIDAFAKAIALNPALLKARYNQAVTYDRMRNFRYSEFVFRNLIKSYPQYALGYDGLAVTLSKAGRGKEALAFHEKAIALTPSEPSFYFNYAISNLMIGNTAKAMEQQEKLKTIDPVIAERLASVIVKKQM